MVPSAGRACVAIFLLRGKDPLICQGIDSQKHAIWSFCSLGWWFTSFLPWCSAAISAAWNKDHPYHVSCKRQPSLAEEKSNTGNNPYPTMATSLYAFRRLPRYSRSYYYSIRYYYREWWRLGTLVELWIWVSGFRYECCGDRKAALFLNRRLGSCLRKSPQSILVVMMRGCKSPVLIIVGNSDESIGKLAGDFLERWSWRGRVGCLLILKHLWSFDEGLVSFTRKGARVTWNLQELRIHMGTKSLR